MLQLKDNVRHIVGVDSFGSLAVFRDLAQPIQGVDPCMFKCILPLYVRRAIYIV